MAGLVATLFSSGVLGQKLDSAAPIAAGCYARLDDGLLAIGNRRIRREFLWNDGNLISLTIGDVPRGEVIVFEKPGPDFQFGDLTKKPVSGLWSSQVVASPISAAHLEVEVITSYESLQLRRVFRVYPDCSAIGCDYYLRARTSGLPTGAVESTLQRLALPGVHWDFKAVEFFDQTDHINNLVRETSGLAYQRPFELRGNVLWATQTLHDLALFEVKEAPCSFVQLDYPGYDFRCSIGDVRVMGAGITPGDLSEEKWTRVYGVATGVCGDTESDFLFALRGYQKYLRQHLPQRDDMIMMNTWGDRNRDARIGEQFVKEQVDACVQLGITHLQIDDGWQQGLSKNSASNSGRLWDQWDQESWQPNSERFPNGFAPVVDYARHRGVDLGLWFHPSNADNYAQWKRDAEIVINLYQKFGIRYFKIDGVKLPTKSAEVNLRKFFDRVLEGTDYAVVFNLDATADNRAGYHYFCEYGNVFLENRYTDFGRYYPHWTLRNLWMLSRYVPPERLQIEFLNKWRNANKYDRHDPLAPAEVPFDFQFAGTMMAQPLAWFEGSELPEEGRAIAPIVKAYREHMSEIHQGIILPIGEEPSGTSWTGFQSVAGPFAGIPVGNARVHAPGSRTHAAASVAFLRTAL